MSWYLGYHCRHDVVVTNPFDQPRARPSGLSPRSRTFPLGEGVKAPPARLDDPLREVIADLAEAVGALARANDASQIVRIEPILVDLKTAAQLVGCSVSVLRTECRAGRLEFRNRGTAEKPRYSVLVSELNRWANGLPTGKPR